MKRMLYGAVLLMVMSTSCQKNDESIPSTSPIDREVTFAPTIAKITRSPQLNDDGSGTFNEGDAFTLYAHDDADGSSTLDYTLGLSTLHWKDLAFVSEGGKVNFVACYPPQTLDGDSFDFTVKQTPEADLLLATSTNVSVGDERPVALTFQHAMHRLAVNFLVKDFSIETTSIETQCTAYASCRVHLPSGSLLRGDTKDTYTMKGSNVKFLLLPQSTQDVTLKVQTGETAHEWTLAALDSRFETLEPGQELTVNFTVLDGKISFSGITVENWGNQGTIDGEIIL